MNKKLLFIIPVLLVLCALLIFLGLRQQAVPAGGPDTHENQNDDVPAPITATLAVCGDMMSHSPQTNDAYNAATNTYSYQPCFQYVKPWIESADYAVVNLETTLNGPPYSGYPQFCAPDALAKDAKAIGFDLVSTANNHSMDKGFDGIVRTLDTLDKAGLAHVGSYRTQEEFDKNNGVVVADVGGISVAFLSYTYGTNGIPIQEARNFSLNCFNTDYMSTCTNLNQEKLKKELEHAKSLKPDLIAVMIHWGIEYQTSQNDYQTKVADFLIANGADVILGSHSHVPQPMETRNVTLEDGSVRSGFVSYSLGNFVSNQSPATVSVNYTDTTAVLNLELTKDFSSGETTITNVSYVPLLVLNRGPGVQDQYLILDVNDAMADYNAGERSLVSDAVYGQLQYALEGCHNILGKDFDSAGAPPSSAA